MSSFQLAGLPYELFADYFSLSDAELGARGMHRVVATEQPGFPCRVSLRDAEVGDELLLLHYEHQAANTPYRASGPIFVRRGAEPRILAPGVVPSYVRSRLMSLRAYDCANLMTDAAVCEGSDVASVLKRLFDQQEVACVHLHNAKRGCYSCRAIRASAAGA